MNRTTLHFDAVLISIHREHRPPFWVKLYLRHEGWSNMSDLRSDRTFLSSKEAKTFANKWATKYGITLKWLRD